MLEVLKNPGIQGRLEALGYSLLFAYAAFGFGYVVAKSTKKPRTQA